jgi:NTP pyrophosphatase (non-canonical NTP hydrolase)
MSLEDLEVKVTKWAEDRGIFAQSSDGAQVVKLREELGELRDAISAYNTVAPTEIVYNDIKDGIGDMLVVLTLIAKFNNLSLTDCYSHAYNQIKDRRGRMINGLFVKEA